MDNLYLFLIAATAFFAIIVTIRVVFFAIKHRDDTRLTVGAPISGSLPMEIGWSLIPFIVATGILVYATVVYFEICPPRLAFVR